MQSQELFPWRLKALHLVGNTGDHVQYMQGAEAMKMATRLDALQVGNLPTPKKATALWSSPLNWAWNPPLLSLARELSDENQNI